MFRNLWGSLPWLYKLYPELNPVIAPQRNQLIWGMGFLHDIMAGGADWESAKAQFTELWFKSGTSLKTSNFASDDCKLQSVFDSKMVPIPPFLSKSIVDKPLINLHFMGKIIDTPFEPWTSPCIHYTGWLIRIPIWVEMNPNKPGRVLIPNKISI